MQSSEGLSGACRYISKLLEPQNSHADSFPFGLLCCLHDVVAGLPWNEQSREQEKKIQFLLQPSLESYMLSLLQFFIGHLN